MPDGVRNGIADKSSDKKFLSDDEEEEERDGVVTTAPSLSESDIDTLTTAKKGSRNKLPPSQSSLNLFDLLKTGAMIGEKNGNSGGSQNRLRLSSSARDSDYVILVLNQKQREDDEVNMLIDRLRGNGVSCLFMKNGTHNSSPKSPTPAPVPLLPLLSSSEEVPEVTSNKCPLFSHPTEKVQNSTVNGKSCLCKCNNRVCMSRTCLQFNSSATIISESSLLGKSLSVPISTKSPQRDISDPHSQSVDDNTKQNPDQPHTLPTLTSIPCPRLILRLPIPVLKVTPTITNASLSDEQQSNSATQDQGIKPEIEDADHKRRRKRRRKYPYHVRKTAKKRKFSKQEPELILQTPTATIITTSTNCSTIASPTKPKCVQVQNAKKVGRPPNSLSKCSKPTTNSSSPKHKSKSKKPNGLSPTAQSSPSSQLLLFPPDDPYVFIPDDTDDLVPIPKLFSPKCGRKNGLCSSNNGLLVSSLSPTQLPLNHTHSLVSSPTRKSSPVPPVTSIEEVVPPSVITASTEKEVNPCPPEEAAPTLEHKNKTKRKRKNEVCQLLTWAISARPSTPRSTLSTAFLPKETKVVDLHVQAAATTAITPQIEIDIDTQPHHEALGAVAPAIELQEGTTVENVGLIACVAHESIQTPVDIQPETKSQGCSLAVSDSFQLNEQEHLPEIASMPMPFVRPPWSSKRGKALKRKRKRRSEIHYKVKKSKVQNLKTNCVQAISSPLQEEQLIREGVDDCANVESEWVVRTLGENRFSSEENDKNVTSALNPTGTCTAIAKSLGQEEDVSWKYDGRASTAFDDPLDSDKYEENKVAINDHPTSTPPPENDILLPVSTNDIQQEVPMSENWPQWKPVLEEIWKVPAIPEPSTSTGATTATTTDDSQIPNSFLDAMQLRRPSFYSQIAGNVRNNMENFLDGRPPASSNGEGSSVKTKRRRKPRSRNGYLLHHGDNFQYGDTYKLHLATQIILKLNKRRSKFKPKEDKGKSLLSYLKLVPKRVSRTSKNTIPAVVPTTGEDSSNKDKDAEGSTISSVFSGEWVQPRNFICNICGHVEKDFWDMVHHKGEIHPGIVVTHVELQDMPPEGFRQPPPMPSTEGLPPPGPCTKCAASFSTYADLHLHIFECAGNTTWLNQKKDEEPQPQKKKKLKKKRGFNRFKRRLSNTPRKCKQESSPQKRRTVEVFNCEFCTREFKTEGWLKNHLTTHSLPISIPLDKLKQSLPAHASNNIGRRSVVQNLLANGSFSKS